MADEALTLIDADGQEHVLPSEGRYVDGTALAEATGWALKPEGLCQGPVCVPVPKGREADFVDDEGGLVNIAGFWRHMGRAVAHGGETWVLGAAAEERAQALRSLTAQDFALPDLNGRTHRLSEHFGKKILLTTWASW